MNLGNGNSQEIRELGSAYAVGVVASLCAFLLFHLIAKAHIQVYFYVSFLALLFAIPIGLFGRRRKSLRWTQVSASLMLFYLVAFAFSFFYKD